MPKPVKRRALIRRLQLLGWSRPESGGSHQFMRKDGRRLIVPNPHGGDLGWTLVNGYWLKRESAAKNGTKQANNSRRAPELDLDSPPTLDGV